MGDIERAEQSAIQEAAKGNPQAVPKVEPSVFPAWLLWTAVVFTIGFGLLPPFFPLIAPKLFQSSSHAKSRGVLVALSFTASYLCVLVVGRVIYISSSPRRCVFDQVKDKEAVKQAARYVYELAACTTTVAGVAWYTICSTLDKWHDPSSSAFSDTYFNLLYPIVVGVALLSVLPAIPKLRKLYPELSGHELALALLAAIITIVLVLGASTVGAADAAAPSSLPTTPVSARKAGAKTE